VAPPLVIGSAAIKTGLRGGSPAPIVDEGAFRPKNKADFGEH